MALVVAINSVTKGIRQLNISSSQNEKDRLTCVLVSQDGSDIPAIDAEITATEDGTNIFGGSIKTPTLMGIGDASDNGVLSNISALDFNELADRQTVTMTIPAGGTLKAAATALLPYISGVSLDGAQLDGPTIDVDLVWVDVYITAALDELSTRTGWLRNINGSKVLKFFEPGTVAAPWNITALASDTNTIGDVTVTPTRIDYANRIIVKFTESARSAYAFLQATANFSNGEQVVIGTQTYTFQTVLTDVAGNVKIGGSAEISLGNLVAAINHAGGGQYAASTPIHPSVEASMFSADTMKARASTAGAAGNGIAISETGANANWHGEGSVPLAALALGSDSALTNKAQADDLVEQALTGVGIYTKIYEAASVIDYESALALAEALLAVSTVTYRNVTYDTYRAGLFVGMTQTINRPTRGLISASCLITSITHQMIEGSILRRSVQLIVGDTYKGDRWRNQYKKWAGASSGIAGSVTVGGGGSSAANRPIYFLGGSPEVWMQSPTPTWVPAAGNSEGGIEYVIDTTVRGSTIATVRVRLRAQSGSVTARLYDLDAAAQCGISDAVTSTTFVLKSFAVALTAGAHRYRLELLPGSANVDVNGVGYLE